MAVLYTLLQIKLAIIAHGLQSRLLLMDSDMPFLHQFKLSSELCPSVMLMSGAPQVFSQIEISIYGIPAHQSFLKTMDCPIQAQWGVACCANHVGSIAPPSSILWSSSWGFCSMILLLLRLNTSFMNSEAYTVFLWTDIFNIVVFFWSQCK